MLFGFLGCVILKSYSALNGISLPMYLDPFFVGILLSVIGAIIGTKTAPKSAAEEAEQAALFKSSEDIGNMKKYGYGYLVFAILFTAFMFIAYAIPYINAVS